MLEKLKVAPNNPGKPQNSSEKPQISLEKLPESPEKPPKVLPQSSIFSLECCALRFNESKMLPTATSYELREQDGSPSLKEHHNLAQNTSYFMVNLEWIETDGNVIFGNPKDPNVHHSPPIEPKRSIGHDCPNTTDPAARNPWFQVSTPLMNEDRRNSIDRVHDGVAVVQDANDWIDHGHSPPYHD